MAVLSPTPSSEFQALPQLTPKLSAPRRADCARLGLHSASSPPTPLTLAFSLFGSLGGLFEGRRRCWTGCLAHSPPCYMPPLALRAVPPDRRLGHPGPFGWSFLLEQAPPIPALPVRHSEIARECTLLAQSGLPVP